MVGSLSITFQNELVMKSISTSHPSLSLLRLSWRVLWSWSGSDMSSDRLAPGVWGVIGSYEIKSNSLRWCGKETVWTGGFVALARERELCNLQLVNGAICECIMISAQLLISTKSRHVLIGFHSSADVRCRLTDTPGCAFTDVGITVI